jgi:Ca2+-binding EF-hand superfamily protein
MVSGISGGKNGFDMAAMWQDLLKKADKDGDGKISKEEFKAGMPQAGPNADSLFSEIDTNGDGAIDESESAAAAQKMHKKHGHGSGGPMQVFEKADSDSDGKISKSEFKAALPEGTDSATANRVFDSMDTNQDGVVDAQEYMAAMQKTDMMTQVFGQENGFSTLA